MAPSAVANVADIYDLGPDMGRAGAVAASTDTGAAGYYNPAGLAFRDHTHLRFGVQGVFSGLERNGQSTAIKQPFGFLVQAAGRLPLLAPLDDTIGVGVNFYAPPGLLIGTATPQSQDAFFPYYDARSSRLMIVPAIAARIQEFSFGVAANYFAGLTGTLDANDASGDLSAEISQEVRHTASYNLGARYGSENWSIGFTFREAFVVPVQNSTVTDVEDAPVQLEINGRALYTPQTFVLAGAYRAEWLEVGLDVSYRRWSKYPAPFAQTRASVMVPGGGGAELLAAPVVSRIETRDVVRVAGSAAATVAQDWRLTVGYAFEPSPFEPAVGAHNPIDGPKHIFGLGASWSPLNLGRSRLLVELAAQGHWMTFTTLTKSPAAIPDEDPLQPGLQTTNPGYPSIEGGGLVVAATLGVAIELNAVPEAGP